VVTWRTSTVQFNLQKAKPKKLETINQSLEVQIQKFKLQVREKEKQYYVVGISEAAKDEHKTTIVRTEQVPCQGGLVCNRQRPRVK
jgi:hypothetical protein